MNLYLLTQKTNTGYDTYDSCVVAAENEDDARLVRPDGEKWGNEVFDNWANDPSEVYVKYIGSTDIKPFCEVICASFNAG